MDEDLKELEAMLKSIDAKVKSSIGFKFLKIIKSTLPVSAFIIFGLILFLLIIIGVGAIFESLKSIEIDDGIIVEDDFYEETSGFFDPKKIASYMELENNSYIEYTDGEEKATEYLDDEEISSSTTPVKIKLNMTKEHRLHWQLLAAVDILSGYGEDPNDNTVEKLSKKLLPEFEYIEYYETITFSELVDIEIEKIIPGNSKPVIIIVQKLKTTVIQKPQIVLKSVKSAFFDIKYTYEKVKSTNSSNSIIECYALSDVDKKINNRLEDFLHSKEFKNRINITNISEIYDFGVEFPESSDFGSYMLEYIALNPNINVEIRNYNGEGNYLVTEDNKMFRVPIKFEKENSTNNKVYISSFFGERYLTIAGVTQKNFHRGLDFAIPSGTPIVAVSDGEVIRAEYNKSYGNVIEIKHDNTYSTVYAHNARLISKLGDKVKKGDIISLSGNTGVSTGPHLHFEIKINGNPTDPFSMLNLE